jgi:hypothetical protein
MDGLEDATDAPLVAGEAYKLFLDIRALSESIHPTDLSAEIEYEKRRSAQRIEELEAMGEAELCASQTD